MHRLRGAMQVGMLTDGDEKLQLAQLEPPHGRLQRRRRCRPRPLLHRHRDIQFDIN